MITKYNVGDTVLIPMTIDSITLDEKGSCYHLALGDLMRIGSKGYLIDEDAIHSRLEIEEEPDNGELKDVEKGDPVEEPDKDESGEGEADGE